eukprot:615238-Karenia_brevis.AAC.1
MMVLARRLVLPGPPLHVALNFVEMPTHRHALCAFLAGDFFLGRYAANYFAKRLVPQSQRRRADLADMGLDADRVCLHCWCALDTPTLEDEGHMCFTCPAYNLQRQQLLTQLSQATKERIMEKPEDTDKLLVALSSNNPQDWNALASFLTRARQVRRHRKKHYQSLSESLSTKAFGTRKAAWRTNGRA